MKHDSDRGKGKVGEALHRDAEQTKHDVTLGRKGRDLDQDVPDTVGQATGHKPIPPRNTPSRDER